MMLSVTLSIEEEMSLFNMYLGSNEGEGYMMQPSPELLGLFLSLNSCWLRLAAFDADFLWTANLAQRNVNSEDAVLVVSLDLVRIDRASEGRWHAC